MLVLDVAGLCTPSASLLYALLMGLPGWPVVFALSLTQCMHMTLPADALVLSVPTFRQQQLLSGSASLALQQLAQGRRNLFGKADQVIYLMISLWGWLPVGTPS